MSAVNLPLDVLPGRYSVCRLDSGEAIPAWATRGGFFAVVGTAEELSIVCEESLAPADVKAEQGWRCLKVEGPLDFALTGILASLSLPLAKAGISLFAVSTFDTDYLLVREASFDQAVAVLSLEGHTVRKS